MTFLLLAWGLAGCGGGGGTSHSAAAPTATTPPAATRTPIPLAAGAGVTSTITNASVSASGTVTVSFTLTDADGIPLAPVLAAAQNDQQARVRFALAHIEDYSGAGELGNTFSRYVNDVNATNPAYDSQGALQTIDAEGGMYSYTFGTQLAPGFDARRTYSIGIQVDRTVGGHQIGVDPTFDFVPAGGTPEIRQDTTTHQCNSCHNPLTAHGNRREVPLCVLCHTEAAVDPQGNTIEFRNMIHKIHRGKDLPSVVNGAPGSFYGIYSGFSKAYTIFAQKDAGGVVTGVGFPRAIEDCTVCHSQGATANFYKEKSSTAACASCHDDVNPSLTATAAGAPGTKHFQTKGYPEGQCEFCHKADADKEFDVTVPGAHVVPERSTQLKGLVVAIVGVDNHQAGQTPTISFTVASSDTTSLSKDEVTSLNRLAFAIAGPTTDYGTLLTPTAVGGGASGTLTGPDANGVFQYTPTAANAIPTNATGTWSVGAEARRIVMLATTPEVSPVSTEEAAVNPVVTFTVDGSIALARRTVVVDQNCASCHGEFSKGFSIHGNLRNQTEYCVLCHNHTNNDAARRKSDPAAVARGDQTTTIDFKVMIHKIHRGENLERKPYLVYGFGPPPLNYAINDFSNIRFPGDLRDCAKCHAAGTYLLPPFPDTALGTRVTHLDPATRNEVDDARLGPIRAVCTACHDGDDAVAHAETQTAPNGDEACAVCHEEGRDFAVSRLHAGRN